MTATRRRLYGVVASSEDLAAPLDSLRFNLLRKTVAEAIYDRDRATNIANDAIQHHIDTPTEKSRARAVKAVRDLPFRIMQADVTITEVIDHDLLATDPVPTEDDREAVEPEPEPEPEPQMQRI